SWNTRRGLEVEGGQGVVHLEPVDQDATDEPCTAGDQDVFVRCRHRVLRAPLALVKVRCRVHETMPPGCAAPQVGDTLILTSGPSPRRSAPRALPDARGDESPRDLAQPA